MKVNNINQLSNLNLIKVQINKSPKFVQVIVGYQSSSNEVSPVSFQFIERFPSILHKYFLLPRVERIKKQMLD